MAISTVDVNGHFVLGRCIVNFHVVHSDGCERGHVSRGLHNLRRIYSIETWVLQMVGILQFVKNSGQFPVYQSAVDVDANCFTALRTLRCPPFSLKFGNTYVGYYQSGNAAAYRELTPCDRFLEELSPHLRVEFLERWVVVETCFVVFRFGAAPEANPISNNKQKYVIFQIVIPGRTLMIFWKYISPKATNKNYWHGRNKNRKGIWAKKWILPFVAICKIIILPGGDDNRFAGSCWNDEQQ